MPRPPIGSVTPMMQQYLTIKDQHPDELLFYRLGDFYEMFFDDALIASRELELTLTGRDCGLEERAPMCGIPYHAVENYITRLIDKGYRVATRHWQKAWSSAKSPVSSPQVQLQTSLHYLNARITFWPLYVLKESGQASHMLM